MNAILERPHAVATRSPELALETVVYTIGYEGRTLGEYLALLGASQVRLVIDVRMNPISRKKGFSKGVLANELCNDGIAYLHFRELGIESSLRKNLESEESYEELFNLYSSLILPSATHGLNKLIDALERFSPVALTCFEREARHCHRHCISDYLFNTGLLAHEPIHL